MSYSNGPKIVSSGLLSCYDTTNPRSYPGTGTTWFDLSGNNNHATLTNVAASGRFGPVGLDFAGDDTGYVQSIGAVAFSSAWTYELVIYNNGDTRAIPFITSTNGADTREAINVDLGWTNSGTRHIFLGRDYGSWQGFDTPLAIQNYSFISLQVSMNSGVANVWFSTPQTGLTRPIINGSYATSQSSSEYLYWGKFSGAVGYAINGAVYVTRIYNRALADVELLQNYNASKRRFGIS